MAILIMAVLWRAPREYFTAVFGEHRRERNHPPVRGSLRCPASTRWAGRLHGPDLFEHRVTAYLEAFFRCLGVACERQPVAPQRDNIVARYEPPGATRTLMLEAHQDTVPTDNMTIDPFGARIENGRLYGRGACDIKGGMAAMLAAFARLVREKPAGCANVVMACTSMRSTPSSASSASWPARRPEGRSAPSSPSRPN